MKNLLPSKKQHALLTFIDGFITEHNYAPSYREVARALDYKSVSTVAKHIDGLVERGWLIKRENSKRALEVIYAKEPIRAEKSPAPSLSTDHEAWLLGLVADKLQREDVGAEDATVLNRALAILGFDAAADNRPDATR